MALEADQIGQPRLRKIIGIAGFLSAATIVILMIARMTDSPRPVAVSGTAGGTPSATGCAADGEVIATVQQSPKFQAGGFRVLAVSNTRGTGAPGDQCMAFLATNGGRMLYSYRIEVIGGQPYISGQLSGP